MITYQIKAGTTDVSVVCRAVDSTDGTPETAFDHATSGIDLKYRREGAGNTDITEASLAALTTAHTDGGVEQIGNGYFRLDLPDAACASGVSGVVVHGTATGMVIIGCYIQLIVNTEEDVYTRLGAPAGASVSADIAAIEAQTDDIGAAGAGLTAIPWNAAWDAEVQSECADALNAAEPLDANVTQWAGSAVATPTNAGVPEVDVTHWIGVAQTEALNTAEDLGLMVETTIATLASQTSFTLTAGSADDDAYNDRLILIQDASTAAQKCVGSVSDYTGASKTVTLAADPGIFTMATTDIVRIFAVPAGGGAGLDAAGVRAAVGLASANLDTQLAAIEAQTDDIGVAGAGLTAVPWNAAWDAEVQSEVADALDAAIPGTPTAGSVNDVLKDLDAVLPASTIATATNVSAVETDTQNIQSRIPAALDGGGSIKSAVTHINTVAITGDGSGTPFNVA